MKNFPGSLVFKDYHGFHSWSRKTPHATEQLGLWATTTEDCVSRTHVPQQTTPLQREACAPPLESNPPFAAESLSAAPRSQHC